MKNNRIISLQDIIADIKDEEYIKEKRIPFEITADPFYSESNMKYLEKVIADIESGKAKLVEHDLIEEW